LLHVFIRIDIVESGDEPGSSHITQVDGFMFLELAGTYRPTKWGHMNQPQVATQWNFPVFFRDLATGATGRAIIIEADHTDGPSWTAAQRRRGSSSSHSHSSSLNFKSGRENHSSLQATSALQTRRMIAGDAGYSSTYNLSRSEQMRHSYPEGQQMRRESSQVKTTRRCQIPIRFNANIPANTSCLQVCTL
jgi:hypothetical protein